MLQNNLIVRWDQHPELPVWGIPGQFLTQVLQDFASPIVTHYSSAVTELNNTTAATSPDHGARHHDASQRGVACGGRRGQFQLANRCLGFWLECSQRFAVADGHFACSWSWFGHDAIFGFSQQHGCAAKRQHHDRRSYVSCVADDIYYSGPCRYEDAHGKLHATFGQMGATYTLTLSNHAGAVPTSGVVTVSDTVPAGLTLVSMVGSGWTLLVRAAIAAIAWRAAKVISDDGQTVNVAANARIPSKSSQCLGRRDRPQLTLATSTIIVEIRRRLKFSSNKVQFGYSGQQITGTQTVALNFDPSGAISWTASSNQSNITVSPTSGTGSAQLQITAAAGASGIITVTTPGATNSPQQIHVNVTNVAVGLPFGSFDTPVNNTAGIAGAVPVTGWALDAIQATNVGIWREPVVGETAQSNGLVFIGTAVFVVGARPDVQATYPNAPLNYRGGWGYMLLTNFLPNASGSGPYGNGTYKLHAIITNAKSGQILDLGAHAITVDNVHASRSRSGPSIRQLKGARYQVTPM